MADEWMAACGLDCQACSIRRAPFDDSALEECISWYREMGWLEPGEGRAEILERKLYCTGCMGDRSSHWSVDEDGHVMCWILDCCVDQRRLRACSECDAFPCEKLREWSKTNTEYAAAYARLRKMAAESMGGAE